MRRWTARWLAQFWASDASCGSAVSGASPLAARSWFMALMTADAVAVVSVAGAAEGGAGACVVGGVVGGAVVAGAG